MVDGTYQRVSGSRMYEPIVRQILSLAAAGEILPGDRLPPERELAERFGVGRNVLREAFRVLESSGIIHSQQGGGRYLRGENLQAILQTDGVILRLEESTISHVLESRDILEGQIARLAAERATDQQAADLIVMCSGSSETWEDNIRFHTSVAAITGNFMLERLVRLQMDLLADVHQRAHYESPGDAARLLAEHMAIAVAVAAHDESGAEAAVHQHFRHTRAILKLPDPNEPRPRPTI